MPVQYSRFFITLRQDSGGYEYNGRTPMGRCVIEARGNVGKVSVAVQDIKAETIYKVYLVAYDNGGSVGVPVGSLHVDRRGKAEMRYELNPDNVAGSGMPLSAFNVVAVVSSVKNGVVSPLTGFSDMPVPWKSNFQDYLDKREEVPRTPTDRSYTSDEADRDQTAVKQVAVNEISANEIATDKTVLKEADFKSEIDDDNVCVESVVKPPQAESEEAFITEEASITSDEPQEVNKKTEIAGELQEVNKETATTGGLREANRETVITDELREANRVMEITGELSEVSIETEITGEPSGANEETKITGELHITNEDAAVSGKSYEASDDTLEASISDQEQQQAFPYTQMQEDTEEPIFLKNNNMRDNEQSAESLDEERELSKLEYIFANNVPAIPFKRQNREVKWVRITLEETDALPLNYQPILQSQLVQAGYLKYDHLILGETGDGANKFCILGVPGIYEAEYRPLAFRLGFSQFKCCEDIKPLKGDYGYWLLPILYE